MKLEVGKTYVIKITDEKNCEILHEYSLRERIVKNIASVLHTLLKTLILLVSVCVPPLLLITLPIFRKTKKTQSHKMHYKDAR